MPITMLDAVDFTKVPTLQFALPLVSSDPAGYVSGLIFNSTSNQVKFWDPSANAGAGGWVAFGPAGAGGPPTGAATGDLSGSYPAPQIAAGVIVDADVNASAAIQQSKIQNLTTDLSGKLPLAGGTMTGDITMSNNRFLIGAAGAGTGFTIKPGNASDGWVDVNTGYGGDVLTDNLGKGNGPGSWILVSANLNLNNTVRVINMPDPTSPQEGATKAYVDNLASGIDARASVKAASTANLTLSGTQTVDGIALVANDRVLVKDQTTATGNGIYLVAAGAWTRTTDMDAWTEFPSAYVWVEQGTANADTAWVCTVDQGGTLGSTNVTWVMFSAASGTITPGAGLVKTGSAFDVVSANTDMTVGADSITINSAPKWTTGRQIVLSGDITGTSNSWDGSGNLTTFSTAIGAGVIVDADVNAANKDGAAATPSMRTLGTGATQAAAGNHNHDGSYLKKELFVLAGAITGGTPVQITHTLNSKDIEVAVYQYASPYARVMCGVEFFSTTRVDLKFASSWPGSSFKVVLMG